MFSVFGLGVKGEWIGWFFRVVLFCFCEVWFGFRVTQVFLFSFSHTLLCFFFFLVWGFLIFVSEKMEERWERWRSSQLVWWGAVETATVFLSLGFFFFCLLYSLSFLCTFAAIIFYSKYMDLPLLSFWGLLFLIGIGFASNFYLLNIDIDKMRTREKRIQIEGEREREECVSWLNYLLTRFTLDFFYF